MITLYYGTSSKNIDLILNKGLIKPNLTNSKQNAANYAEKSIKNKNEIPIVLKVVIDDIKALKINNYDNCIKYKKNIPLKNIKYCYTKQDNKNKESFILIGIPYKLKNNNDKRRIINVIFKLFSKCFENSPKCRKIFDSLYTTSKF